MRTAWCTLSALSLLLIANVVSASDLRLVEAVKQKNKSAVRALLKQRVDVNTPQGDGATALHWAAHWDDLETVELLLAARANVNAANDLKITPLALASVNGNTAVIEKLLGAGADTEMASESGVTPLMLAARTGKVAAVRALLAHEAKVNAKESDRHQTALMWAVVQQHHEVVQALLERGADVHARTQTRPTMVMLDQGPRRIVKRSPEVGTILEMGGSTALMFAAQVGDIESAKLLLLAGARVNDTAADGKSPLVMAVFAGHGAFASYLLEAGADANAAEAGYSALHAAVLRGNLNVVNALLANGANPNSQITKGSRVNRFGSQWALPNTLVGATPLFLSACYLEVDIMRALLARGADPRHGLKDGVTPLLVAAGIEIEKQNRPSERVERGDADQEFGRTAGPESRVVETLQLLLNAGADVNGPNQAGDTALHAAAAGGLTTVIQLLADRGAKLDAKNQSGQTPLSLTTGGGAQGQRGGGGPPRPSPRLKDAEDLLRKLGATN